MFCTACATHNLETLPHCGVCGARLSARMAMGGRPRQRGGRMLGRFLRWFRLVPILVAVLGLAGVGSSYAHQMSRRSDAYAAAEAALARGDTAAAIAAFDRAGAYRDAAARRVALTAQLAPYRTDYLAAVDALGAGDADAAIALLTRVVRDEPGYEDAASLLETARERRREELAAGAELAASQKDWLTAEALLAQLVAERPDPAREAELAEIRRRRAPVLFTVEGNIRLATPDGSGVVDVLDGFSALYPTWSPDRESIAFYTTVGQNVVSYNLWVIDRRGGEPRLVDDHVYAETFAAWSPDSSRLAFVKQERFELDGHDGVSSIRIAHLDTGEMTDLSRTVAHQALSPTWSPSGDRVAFVAKILYGRSSTVTWRQVGSVYVADLERGTVTDVTTDRLRFVDYVAWSPTSDHLALWAKESATSWQETTITTIHLLDLATGAISDGTSRARFVSKPIWSPNGEQFAYVDGDRDITIDGIDGSTRTISLSTTVSTLLSWSPDGSSLIAPSSRPQLGAPVVPVEGTGEVGFLFPIRWDYSGDLVGTPRWGGGRPVALLIAPTLDGTALDH